MAGKWTIISLGGAVIVPNDVDVGFIRKFCSLIKKFKDKRFVIICGGGGTNRRYNAAAKKLGSPSSEDLDWLGIRSLKLNAELVRIAFGKKAHSKVIDNPRDLKRLPGEKIIIAAAFAPGHSSDYDAVLWARRFKANSVINLSNISYVYSSDPQKNRFAKPLKDMSWPDYLKIVGTKWQPRLSTPFDPVASSLAFKLNFRVYILNGRDLPNVKRAISGQSFQGSILHP